MRSVVSYLRRPGLVFALIALGTFGRSCARLIDGHEAFTEGSYDFYLAIARNALEGRGLCLADACALRAPLYSIFLMPFVAADALFPWVSLVQAGVGGLLAWFVYRIALDLHGRAAGIAACAMAAASPYALVHDTALQETIFVNAAIAGAVVCLLAWWQSGSRRCAFGAGMMLGLAALTTTRVTLMVAAAVIWALVESRHTRRRFTHAALFVALPATLLLGAWSVRNWHVVGAPVQSTDVGSSLWTGNNAWTFRYFPEQSIDLAKRAAWQHVPRDQFAALLSLDRVAQDRQLLSLGWDYIRAHPGETVTGAARKLWVVVSAELSPRRSTAADAGYRAVYLSVHLLAAWAMFRTGVRDARHRLMVGLFTAFAVTTAVFWAHTSHKSVIDGLLFVYAAATLARAGGTGAGHPLDDTSRA